MFTSLGPRVTRALLFALALAACGGDDGDDDTPGDDDAATGADAAPTPDGGAAADAEPPPACPREPAAADRVRKVVVSHPYDGRGAPATVYEVLDLDPAGAITRPGVTFDMGRAYLGEIVFTPDGEVGMLAQDDGTIGVFRFDDAGLPEVVDAAYDADGADGFYAHRIVVDPDGQGAYVLSSQWRENGGGIYRVAIGCDGTLAFEGLSVPSQLPYTLSLAGTDGLGLVAAADLLDSPAGDDVHMVRWNGDQAELVTSADAFPDDDYIVGSAALTADGQYLLVGDNNQFYVDPEMQNRIAVVAVGGGELTPVQVLSPLLDPYAIVTSPFGGAAIAVSGFGDAIFELRYDPGDAASPFEIAGELSYEGAPPALPAAAVLIDRGALRGRVLVAENVGVRQIAFGEDGTVTDLGATSFGDGLVEVVGALGVQP
jgi:hypothetical protein